MGKNTKRYYDLVVIGAGASGMMSAITAARTGKKVCILEKLDKAGKKLLATGNGKCNFTNENMRVECFGGDEAFVRSVLDRFSVSDCLEFFQSIGIYPKSKNGYYYPNSEQALSVVNALLEELDRLKVEILFETSVTDILSSKDCVTIITSHGSFMGKNVILATGLLAAPKLGSDGSMFEIVKSMGHRFVPILPTLCGFYCSGISFKKISGVRATGTVKALIDNQVVAEDTGEIQFTDYGLSGIPVFQISRFLSKGLYNKADVKIATNLLPEWSSEQVIQELKRRQNMKHSQNASTLLNGLINQKLADLIFEKSGIDAKVSCEVLSEKQLERIASNLLNLVVSVNKYRDFEFAQVCTGGIPVSDVNWNTLESKFAKSIHFTGEILDVDGICGGYNLHFAWATGYIAGSSVID